MNRYAVKIMCDNNAAALIIAGAFLKAGLLPIIEPKSTVVILVSEKETAEKLAETIRAAKFEPIIEERE